MLLFGKPTHYFLCSGDAESFSPLNAFDCALLAAGVGNTNLMKMSSILPPAMTQTDIVPLEPGSFVPLAYADITSSIPGEHVAAAVAVAIPEDPSLPGVIMEHHSTGHAEDVERQVRAMAEAAMIHRGFKIKEIKSISAEHTVQKHGAAFAAVVLHRL
jgi:arginine decarboxylase